MSNPWDRLPDEPTLWFDRFEEFRLMGPKRSMLGLYKRHRDPGDPTPSAAPSSWNEIASRWQWRERADAWDNYERQRARDEIEEERKKDRAERIQMMKALRSKLVQGLLAADPAELGWPNLIAGFKLVADQLRAEFGDDVQRMDVSVSGTGVAVYLPQKQPVEGEEDGA